MIQKVELLVLVFAGGGFCQTCSSTYMSCGKTGTYVYIYIYTYLMIYLSRQVKPNIYANLDTSMLYNSARFFFGDGEEVAVLVGRRSQVTRMEFVTKQITSNNAKLRVVGIAFRRLEVKQTR